MTLGSENHTASSVRCFVIVGGSTHLLCFNAELLLKSLLPIIVGIYAGGWALRALENLQLGLDIGANQVQGCIDQAL